MTAIINTPVWNSCGHILASLAANRSSFNNLLSPSWPSTLTLFVFVASDGFKFHLTLIFCLPLKLSLFLPLRAVFFTLLSIFHTGSRWNIKVGPTPPSLSNMFSSCILGSPPQYPQNTFITHSSLENGTQVATEGLDHTSCISIKGLFRTIKFPKF